jgi:hypothetical protein
MILLLAKVRVLSMLAKMIPGRLGLVEGSDGSASPSDSPDDRSRIRVFHPFLIAVFPILSLYSHNVYELPLEVLLKPLGLALAVTATVWLSLRFWTRDRLRAGLATSMLAVLFFGFERLHLVLENGWIWLNSFWVDHEAQVHPLAVLMAEALLAIVGFWTIYRRIRRPSVWTSYLNAFTLILVALPTFSLVSSRVREAGTHRDGALPSLGQRSRTPDIYFIVLDGYARSDVMKEVYGFDNRPFLDRLERRGFFVASQSTANYCQTPLSLASTLNAEYLDQLIEPETRDLLPLTDLIKQNRVADRLRSRGYRTISFATGFEPTDNADADVYLAPGPGHSPFNDILIGMTPLAPILAEPRWNDRFSMSRQRTLFVLDRLPSIARIPGPTFTFAHIVSPHPPFLFGEHGEDVSPRQFGPNRELIPRKFDPFMGTPEYVRQGYRNQSAFLTARIERVIEQILKQSPEPPVIILQSDHGAWLHYHPNDVEATDLRERFGTLNAILIPGLKYEGLTQQATSVNTFRIVLNNVFGANMPLLEPRNYFSTLSDPLVLTDVSERLHSEKERTRKFQPPDAYNGLLQQF